MSKLALIACLSLFVSLAACAERGGDVTSTDTATATATEALTDDASELVVGQSCLDRLTDDNDACTAAYNTCMAGATTWWDKARCVTRRSACMAEASARFIGCIRGLLQPTTQPAGNPVPATEATKTSRLEDAMAPDEPFAPIRMLGTTDRIGCAAAS
jgi:hypothetical protein